MPRAYLLATAALLPFSLLLLSCGGEDSPSGAQGGATADSSDTDRRWLTSSRRRRMYVPVDRPQATQARWDCHYGRVLHVNLLINGNVLIRGYQWRLENDSEQERLEEMKGIRSALAQRCAASEGRTVAGECRLPLMLNADRSVHWEHMRAVLRCAMEEPIRTGRLLWSATSPLTHRVVYPEASLSPLARGEAPADESTLLVELRGRRVDQKTASVKLAIGALQWTSNTPFAPEWGYGVIAPRPWAAARAHLEAVAAQHDSAEVRIDEPAPGLRWGHLAHILDLIVGAGLREVDLPNFGIRLSLAEPDDLSVDPFFYEDDPVLSPLTVVLSVLALLIAFGFTFAPLRGLSQRRRSRRRP